jgi:hypothetical protein
MSMRDLLRLGAAYSVAVKRESGKPRSRIGNPICRMTAPVRLRRDLSRGNRSPGRPRIRYIPLRDGLQAICPT